jgi:hypothetical protein
VISLFELPDLVFELLDVLQRPLRKGGSLF